MTDRKVHDLSPLQNFNSFEKSNSVGLEQFARTAFHTKEGIVALPTSAQIDVSRTEIAVRHNRVLFPERAPNVGYDPKKLAMAILIGDFESREEIKGYYYHERNNTTTMMKFTLEDAANVLVQCAKEVGWSQEQVGDLLNAYTSIPTHKTDVVHKNDVAFSLRETLQHQLEQRKIRTGNIAQDIESIRKGSIYPAQVIQNERDIDSVSKIYVKCIHKLNNIKGISVDEKNRRQQELFSIALEGRLGENTIPSPDQIAGRSNHYDGYSYREVLLRTYVNNPELAHALLDERIMGGHGSKSGSLLGTIDHGLRPLNTLSELGLLPVNGEMIGGGAGYSEKYVSFSNWYDTTTLFKYSGEEAVPITSSMIDEAISVCDQLATENTQTVEKLEKALLAFSPETEDYRKASTLIKRSDRQYEMIELKKKTLLEIKNKLAKQPTNEQEQEEQELLRDNFPIIYFINDDGFVKGTEHIPNGPDSEFGLRGGVNSERIRIMLVPKDQVERTRHILRKYNRQTRVFPLEDFSEYSS